MFRSFIRPKSLVDVTSLNNVYYRTINDVQSALGEKPKNHRRNTSSKRIFVIDFDGDVMASQVSALTFEITAILCNALVNDKVLIRLTSPGGAAHTYGLVASQVERLKKAGIEVIVAIDKVAASGGYMVSCVADKIIAAPFSIIGSIGVVSEFPNFSKLLESVGVDYKQYTAGRFKRTVSTLGKITEDGELKFKQDLNDMYDLFREHVSRHRPQMNMDVVATGEHWSALNAIKYGLVDEIKTSEEFIVENLSNYEFIQIRYVGNKKHWLENIGLGIAQSIISNITNKVLSFLYFRF